MFSLGVSAHRGLVYEKRTGRLDGTLGNVWSGNGG